MLLRPAALRLAAATVALRRARGPVIGGTTSSILQRTFAAAAAAAGSPTSVRVEESKEGGSPYAVTGRSGRHLLKADLMPQAGGQDVGPSPKEYVLMALGSCTLMTMRIYSDNMLKSGKWPAGSTIRRLAVECEEYQGEDKHLPAGIRVTVSMDGSNLNEEQTKRLLAAAGKCPVKRMLKGELQDGVTTVLAPAGAGKN